MSAAPEFQTIPINDTWIDNTCDVPFWNHLEGTLRLWTFTDKDGNVTHRLDTLSMTFTTTNPYTGVEYPFQIGGSDSIRWNSNGDMIYTGCGVFDRIIEKGGGAIWNRVGCIRIVTPADGSDPITTFHGNFDSVEDLCTIWQRLSGL